LRFSVLSGLYMIKPSRWVKGIDTLSAVWQRFPIVG
jgi:hypothetical protein